MMAYTRFYKNSVQTAYIHRSLAPKARIYKGCAPDTQQAHIEGVLGAHEPQGSGLQLLRRPHVVRHGRSTGVHLWPQVG